MKQIIYKLYNKIGVKSERTKNITKHVVISFIYKGGSILTTFLLVPITIDFLDKENYGVWLTLSSFIGWFSFFDIGLGNGLRNKFAIAKTRADMTLARGYVSTTYFTVGSVCLFLFLFFILANLFIDWSKVFNTSPSLQKDLSLLMPIVFGFFCLQLVVKLITTIYTADQNHSMQGKINFFTQIISLLLIWIMTKTGESSLLLFGSIFSIFPVLILIGLNIFAFNDRYKMFKPTIKLWKKKYFSDIFGLGLKFFIIQIAGVILFSTDNIIITQLYGPEEVVPYNIAYKYFSIVNMVLTLIMTPYWSSITEAYTKNELEWIKKSMKNLIKITLTSILIIFILILISSTFYKFWVGEKVNIPISLTIYMGIYFCLTNFYTPFTFFINGTGKVKLQMYSILITAFINIPLSVFLAKNLGFGVSGVIFSSIICLIPHIILCPIQYSKIINQKAKGIWNE